MFSSHVNPIHKTQLFGTRLLRRSVKI